MDLLVSPFPSYMLKGQESPRSLSPRPGDSSPPDNVMVVLKGEAIRVCACRTCYPPAHSGHFSRPSSSPQACGTYPCPGHSGHFARPSSSPQAENEQLEEMLKREEARAAREAAAAERLAAELGELQVCVCGRRGGGVEVQVCVAGFGGAGFT